MGTHPVPAVTLPRLPSLPPIEAPVAPAPPLPSALAVPRHLAATFAERCAAYRVSPGRLLAVVMRRWIETHPIAGTPDNTNLEVEVVTETKTEDRRKVSHWLTHDERLLIANRANASRCSTSDVIAYLVETHLRPLSRSSKVDTQKESKHG